MAYGTLEVLLVSAEGLQNSDFLCNMDPYVIVKCRTQEQKSSVSSGQGSNPEWNEKFVFTVSEGTTELILKIMDSDAANEDDFVGEASIPLEALFSEGSLLPTPYNVVLPDKTYCGEIKVGLTFTPQKEEEYGQEAGEQIGGWKESSY
ncbi:hypothetical protein SUGI_0854010 [Cryptomeria japonica]|uniref:elicitor-responsive protein 3 n=1 Tax=Cryptomeria japonica TaxID=3369 RepID=UPI002414AC17|nr:elicitor-responsive protein 3 [Cryptomeria japonica]GLJ41257.1 hypothetical protein SUGI_0854010 [Cryptomeria japonica]